ncbi:MAG: 5'-nucleotidase C-terminal domain-containing protein, partial [Bacteroidota bacterium]
MCSYGQESFTLRIMHNNDGESKLLPTDVDGRTIGGASAFKTAVESLRAEDLPSVMLSSGDNFLAGIAFDANNDDTRAEEPLFDALVLDALAYDAICIGNHDLDFGPDVLADLIEDFETTMPPYLSANLDFAAEGNLQALVETGRIAANTVIELGGESIGVFALTTDNLASITSVGDIVVNTDIVGVAQAQIAELEGQGINKIIMISHLQGIQEEIALAAQLSGVDVIIAGGGDELLTNDATIALPGQDVFGAYPFEVTDAAENTTYIVTTPGEYNYLGNLIVEFDAEGNVSSIDDSSNPILIEGFETDAAIDSTVIQPLLDIISDVTALATTEVDLDGTRGSIRSVETNQGNLIADAFVHAAETATIDGIDPELPIVALTNGGGIRNNNIIRANSTITDQTTQSMLPFGNTVVVLNAVTPIQFKTILENSVAAIGNGEGTGRFGQIGGFSFEYDPAQPNSTFNDEGTVLLTEGSRIISATLADGTVMIADGEVNADAPSVYIVTNNFIAAGRDGYTTFGEVGTLADLGVDYKVALDNYLVGPLAGVVTADAYPEGGEGRITTGEIMTGLNTFTLRLLHNNDGESKLVPQDVDGRLIGGAAEFKTLLDATRTASDDATIFLSSGDNILPGLSFDANEDPSRDGLPLFDATVLDALDYDAICLGNHDFDAGPEVLAQLISDQTNNMAPYLSANLDFSGEAALQPLAAAGRIVPSVVLDVEGEAVGVIGLTTRDLANISSPGDVMINDVLPAAQEQIAIMTESGINKIIVISHLQGIDQEISLAGMLTDVDVIIAGGGSELYTNDSANELPTLNITAAGSYPLEVDDANGNTTYIVTTPGEYRYLGSLTMEFDADGNIVTIGEDSDVILVADETPDADLAETVIAPFEEIIANLTEVLATTEVELDGTRTSIRTMETNVGNLISDAFLFATATNATLPEDLPVVALTNGGGIRNSVVIPAGGDITRVETGMMLPFGNGVEVLGPATPADLKSLLENGLRSAPESTGRFSQVGGMTIVYDPNGTPQQNDDDNTMIVTPGTKVVSVTLEDGTAIIIDGEPVADAPSVYVVTNDFIGGGRDGYVTFASLETVATVGDDYKTVLEEYLVNGLSGVVTAAEYPEGGEGRITATMDMGGDAFTLRVMHNNDGESRLLPSSIDGRSIGGAAAFKTVVDELRAMDTPSIMLSSGDNFLAGVAFDANNDESRDGLPLFDALVLDAIGYDAICIGNHDLDFGPDVLAELINDFQNTAPPYLSANLDFSAEPNLQALVDDGRIAANTILEVNGEQI